MKIEIKTLKQTPKWVEDRKRTQWGKLPFRDLEIGQICLIPVNEQTTKNFKSFRAVVAVTGKRMGRVFVCRQRDDGAFEVYRSE